MFKIFSYATITFIFLLNALWIDYGTTQLTEKCPLPWVPYRLSHGSLVGSNGIERCQNRCVGHAFHTNEGNLICFNKKDVAKRKPQIGDRTSKNGKCECGYFTNGRTRNWMSCNDIRIIETISVKLCNEYCQVITIFMYVRKKRKIILHCERGNRLDFYDIRSDRGKLTFDPNNRKSRCLECTCGLADTNLKRIADKGAPKLDNLEGNFWECSSSWEALDLRVYKNYTPEKCLSFCREVCKTGKGFFYDGKALCYQRNVAATRKASPDDGSNEGECECGYVKRSKDKFSCSSSFMPCHPPIREKILNLTRCRKLCSETRVYINRKFPTGITISCIHKPDPNIAKPQPLVEKCDDETYTRASDSKKYTKCRCGLRWNGNGNLFLNLTKIKDNGEVQIPASWLIKKKRSLRNNQKLKMESLIEN